ncbi:MAG: DUF1573 domain-containing protein [Candidatus Paceibacterota bacterium]
MKNTIITGVIIVIVLVGLMVWGKNNQTTESIKKSEVSSVLTTSEKIYDFGTISMKDGLVNYTFKVTNPSDKDIYIKKINTSCMCTQAYIETADGEKGPFGMEGMGYIPPVNETIKAGEFRNVKVVYDPNAHGPAGVGMIDRFIYLIGADGETTQLEIKAVVTP